MYAQVEKSRENRSRAVVNSVGQKKNDVKQGFGFVDNRAESIQLKKLITFNKSADKTVQLVKGTKSKRSSKKKKVKMVDVKHSHARFARRHQSTFKSSKNIGTMKLYRVVDGKREVIYLNSESLGMGNKSFRSPYEKYNTQAGTKKRRKHSEPGFLFAQKHDKLKSNDGGEEIKVSDYETEWVYSSNEPCGKKVENCKEEIVPKLKTEEGFFYSNPYKGTEESGGMEKLVNNHKREKRKEETDYESDEYSEDEDDIKGVYMIDPGSLSNRAEDDDTPLTIFDFKQELIDKERKDKKNVRGHYHGNPFGK